MVSVLVLQILHHTFNALV